MEGELATWIARRECLRDLRQKQERLSRDVEDVIAHMTSDWQGGCSQALLDLALGRAQDVVNELRELGAK